MKVLKFGGSSVANAENINKVVKIISSHANSIGDIVVVSAFGGITDKLILAAGQAEQHDEAYRQTLKEIEERHLQEVKTLIPVQQQSSVLSLVKKLCNEMEDICNGVYLLNELSARTKDKLVGYGELLSSRIIAACLEAAAIPVTWQDARELIITNSDYGKALVDFAGTNERVRQFFSGHTGKLFLVPGFIAASKAGIPTTLGRGGSDYTAAILAAALGATALEIWTDVSGMMTADPRLVSNSKPIPEISYSEAMELSHFGAKVIYPPTIQPVMTKGIPVWVKNTFAPDDAGTVIQAEAGHPAASISGISSIDNLVLLSLEGSGMVGIPGFSKRLFETLANAAVNVILITQGSSEHSICVGIEAQASARARELLDKAFAYEIETSKVEPIKMEDALSIVAIVGDNMKNHSGISGKMFGALGRNGISIRAIAQGSSERNISAVISTADVKKAVNVLHEEFFETTYKQVNLFIAGSGNVGEKLLALVQQQQIYLQTHLRLHIRVAGIANSRRMYFDEEGIDLKNWKLLLDQGETMDLQSFALQVQKRNLRNSIFVDMTASDLLPDVYAGLLQKSISVVACNKVAASSGYRVYKELKNLATEFNCHFLFETNVGAGLPVIGTLNDLLRSGDKINRIEAVLSGTLNFVFNHYDGSRPFAQVVKQAQEEGYTEPDPRLDLSGKDVMRKILILAREAGEMLEMEAIRNNSFMPASCMEGSVDNFYSEMEKQEPHFRSLLDAAAAAGKKLKFVASYADKKAAVGLQQVDDKSDFYHLYGKDNAVLFYTDRYPEQPLVIKGAGAGAAVTAAGVFADIMRVAKV